MKCLPSQARSSWKWTPVRGDSVRDGRGPQDAQRLRNLACHALGDDDIRSKREVRAVLIERSNRESQPRILSQSALDLTPRYFVERI